MPLCHGITLERNPNYLLGLLVRCVQPLISEWQIKIQTKYPQLRLQEPVHASEGFVCDLSLEKSYRMWSNILVLEE